MLTLEQFKQSAKRMTIAEASDFLDADLSTFNDHAEAVLIYDGVLFIEDHGNGKFWTIIEREEKEGDRATVEGFLYTEWYLTECNIDASFRESDGSLDQVVSDFITGSPDIDESSDDWGGIMGLYFSDTSKDEWTAAEIYQTCKDAARTFGGSK